MGASVRDRDAGACGEVMGVHGREHHHAQADSADRVEPHSRGNEQGHTGEICDQHSQLSDGCGDSMKIFHDDNDDSDEGKESEVTMNRRCRKQINRNIHDIYTVDNVECSLERKVNVLSGAWLKFLQPSTRTFLWCWTCVTDGCTQLGAGFVRRLRGWTIRCLRHILALVFGVPSEILSRGCSGSSSRGG